MSTTDHRLEQISTTDVRGQDASVTVTLHPKRGIQSDTIDGDEPRGVVVRVKLKAAERQALQDVVDRACAKIDARRVARAADPTIRLDTPLTTEQP